MNDNVYQWFTDQPSRYWLLALPFAVLLLLGALQPRRVPRWMFLVFLAAGLLMFRWPVAVAGAENNADESQLIAGAITLLHRPVFWRDVDAHAIGPLAVYPLAFLGALGADLDYETARFFGLFVEWVGLAACYGLLREVSGELWARLGILPLAAFFALTRHQDFLQYSAETMAGALLALGLALMWTGLRRRAAAWQAAGAFVLGCTAWTKLQALPVAVALVAGGLVVHWLGRRETPAGRGREAAMSGAGFLTALVVPLLVMTVAGIRPDWSDAYVRAGLSYLGAAQVAFPAALGWFLSYPGSGFPAYALPLVALALLLGFPALRRDRSLRPFLGVMVVAMLAAGVAIAGSGRLFVHYLGLALWLPVLPAAACCAAVFAALPPARRGWRTGLVLAWLGCTLLPQAAHVLAPGTLRFVFPPGVNHLMIDEACLLIRIEAKPGDTLSVWGWEPRVYVLTGLPQATRESHTERLIEANPLRDFYRARFLADFNRAPPAFFVDGIVPDNFAFNDRRRHGFELWPELARIIAVDYFLLQSADGYRIYRRIDRKG